MHAEPPQGTVKAEPYPTLIYGANCPACKTPARYVITYDPAGAVPTTTQVECNRCDADG